MNHTNLPDPIMDFIINLQKSNETLLERVKELEREIKA
jgi:hypothetical protein